MGYYSIVATVRQPVMVPDPLICIGAGFNTFVVVTDDIESVKTRLENEGVEIQAINRLDDLDPVSSDSILLPGEKAEVLQALNAKK
jgi:hypothetical protein